MQGLLLLNKPDGITSFGAVSKVRRLADEKRVGHTGTLDPMATGVLPIFIGRATVLSSYLSDADKTYIAKAKLGIKTDTLDITGKILSETDVSCTPDKFSSALNSFLGEQKQIPPMFSAIKKNGVKMYDLARNGQSVDIPPRDIRVYSIKILKNLDENNEFSFEITVSKGTYIRSIVRDLGEKLGCGAVLTNLIRTKTAGFDISECVNLENLTPENIESHLISPDKAVSHIDSLTVTPAQAVRFSNGGKLDIERLKICDITEGKLYRVYSPEKFLGLGFIKENQLAIKCLV